MAKRRAKRAQGKAATDPTPTQRAVTLGAFIERCRAEAAEMKRGGPIRPAGVSRERSPAEHIPKNIGEYLSHARLAQNVAPFLRRPDTKPVVPPEVGALMSYLEPFWRSEHHAEVWELYTAWTRPTEADMPTVRDLAARAGLGERAFIYKTALEQIQRYVGVRPHLAAIGSLGTVQANRQIDGASDHGAIEGPNLKPASLLILKAMAENAVVPDQVFPVLQISAFEKHDRSFDFPRCRKGISRHLGFLQKAGFIIRDSDGRNARFTQEGWALASRQGWTKRCVESEPHQQTTPK